MSEHKKKQEEKQSTIYQKLNTVADWFIRLVMVNILMIISALPLITLYSALHAGYRLMYDYTQKDETKIFQGYIMYFKSGLLKKMMFSLLIIFVAIFGYWNVTYYIDQIDQGAGLFFTIGYYITFSVLVSIYVVTLYTWIVMSVFPNIKFGMLIKLSLILAGKYVGHTLLIMVIFVIPYVLMLTPFLFLIFVFFGISTPLLAYTIVTLKPRKYLESLGVKHD